LPAGAVWSRTWKGRGLSFTIRFVEEALSFPGSFLERFAHVARIYWFVKWNFLVEPNRKLEENWRLLLR
jgi:hypothetical protein